MSLITRLGRLSFLSILTAAISLSWIPFLFSTLGTIEYGKFILATTTASIVYSLLYINSWQWLLIQINRNSWQAAKISLIADLTFMVAAVFSALILIEANKYWQLIPNELTPIFLSQITGFALSQQSIYTAFFRHKEQFSPPIFVSLFSEILKASTILTGCYLANSGPDALKILSHSIWLFGIPHLFTNIYAYIAISKRHRELGFENLFSNFFAYNFFLHQKSISDILVNHFDKIIVSINLGYQNLAAYDLLKKSGFAFSKVISPIFPIVFRDLVKSRSSITELKYKLTFYSQKFFVASIIFYLLFEFSLHWVSTWNDYQNITDFVNTYSNEIRVYFLCHLFGFIFSGHHLLLTALENTKLEFYLTASINLMFIGLFFIATKHSLMYGILAIFFQYASLISGKIWIARKLI